MREPAGKVSLAMAGPSRKAAAMLTRALITALALGLTVPLSAEPAADSTAKSEEALSREVRGLQRELTKLEKKYDKLLLRCRGDERNRADARACDTARVLYQDAQALKDRISKLTKS
ncbi:MAG: hypothetical protein AAF291_15210 [Pseudomonadota bacterium]